MIRFLRHAISFLGDKEKYVDRRQPRVTRFLLNKTSYGYNIVRDEGGYQLIYLFYIHDLKLYGSSGTKLQSVLDVTLQFSNDIGMEIGHAPLHNNICREDNGYTTLHLADPNCHNMRHATPEQLVVELREISLHGQHSLVQDQPNADKEASNSWLRRGELFPETEGFFVAIQDKVIGNRNYQKHILHYNIENKCRSFWNPNETIEQITNGCRMLAQRECTRRHNDFVWDYLPTNRLEPETVSRLEALLPTRPGTSSWEWTLSLVLGKDHPDRPPRRT